METVKHELMHAVPPSVSTGVTFVSLEQAVSESLPLALVWYTTRDNSMQRAARIEFNGGNIRVAMEPDGSGSREMLLGEVHLNGYVVVLDCVERRRRSADGGNGAAEKT